VWTREPQVLAAAASPEPRPSSPPALRSRTFPATRPSPPARLHSPAFLHPRAPCSPPPSPLPCVTGPASPAPSRRPPGGGRRFRARTCSAHTVSASRVEMGPAGRAGWRAPCVRRDHFVSARFEGRQFLIFLFLVGAEPWGASGLFAWAVGEPALAPRTFRGTRGCVFMPALASSSSLPPTPSPRRSGGKARECAWRERAGGLGVHVLEQARTIRIE